MVAGFLRALLQAFEIVGETVLVAMASSLARLDYAEVVDGETFERIPEARHGDVTLIAAYVGATRLIDNIIF